MAAKDGSFSFDFEGIYSKVVENELIEYNIIEGREVKIMFSTESSQTKIVEVFEAKNENSLELQQAGSSNFRLFSKNM